jgi:type II secretory pathway component GspD/PulD (secretin)
MPAAFVIADLCTTLEVPVVIPAALEEKPVSVEFVKVPGHIALAEVARAVGMAVLRRDGVITFEAVETMVHDFVVLSPGAAQVKEAQDGIKNVIGQKGSVSIVGEKLIVSGEREALERATELAADLESGADGWLVEVRLLAVSKSLREDLGVDFAFAGGAGVRADAATGNMGPTATPVFGARASLAVDMLVSAALTGREAQLLRTGRLFVLEGSQASLQQGDVIPVPRRTVSDQGTVTVSGYDRIESGFGLDVGAARVPGGVRLQLTARLSSVSGFVEDAPITSESSVVSAVAMKDGEWILLSGFEGMDTEDRVNGLPGPLGKLLGNADHFNTLGASVIMCVQAVRCSSSDEMGGLR